MLLLRSEDGILLLILESLRAPRSLRRSQRTSSVLILAPNGEVNLERHTPVVMSQDPRDHTAADEDTAYWVAIGTQSVLCLCKSKCFAKLVINVPVPDPFNTLMEHFV